MPFSRIGRFERSRLESDRLCLLRGASGIHITGQGLKLSTGRDVYVESGIRGSRRLRFLLLSLSSLLVDQSLVFFEEFPAFALVFPALALLGFLVVSKSVRIGVDRLNNNRGYVKGNVAPCCAPCNYMKRAMPVSTFLGHVALICTHSTPREPRT